MSSDSKTPGKGGPASGSSPEFSIDHQDSGQVEVPSITQLLNRKKLRIEPEKHAPVEIDTQTRAPTGPQIREARRGERRGPTRLELWDETQLGSAQPGSLEQLVRSFRDASKAAWVLVLATAAGGHFEARSVLGGGRSLWTLATGFRWGQAASPASYQALLSQGFHEITPHSNLGDANVLRSALAVEPTQHLWLIACGKRGTPPSRVLVAVAPPGVAAKAWIEKNQASLARI